MDGGAGGSLKVILARAAGDAGAGLTIAEGGYFCTGSGGMGGSATAVDAA